MYSFQGAPITNNGYYDGPINNQYSNKEYRDIPVITNEYQLNKNINVTMNDNKDEYIVYQQPTRPSKSLYTESDKQTSQYYNNERALSFDSHIPLMKKKEQNYNEINQGDYSSFPIESFHGGGNGYGGGQGYGGGNGYRGGQGYGYGGGQGYGGGNGYRGGQGYGYGGGQGYGYGSGQGYGYGGGQGHGGGKGYSHDGSSIILGNGGNQVVDRAYLNTQIMPNISRNYWEYPDYVSDFQILPENVTVIKEPPYNIIPKEEVKIEKLRKKEIVDIEYEKPKKKKKCNKIKSKNKVLVSNQILWGIIIILLLVIIALIMKFYYKK